MTTSQSQAQIPLKERIAALQQKPNASSTHPSAAPARTSTVSSTGQPTTPPRGTLRDKINKFERKGGVPIPRGSFGMGAPPPAEIVSTKSRELYGNRIPSVEKKPSPSSPTGPSRTSTAPSSFPLSSTPVDGADRAPLSPDITGESAAAPELSSAVPDGRPRRRLSVVEMIGQYNELDAAAPSPKPSRRTSQIIAASDSPVAASPPGTESHSTLDMVTPSTGDASALPTPPPSATAEQQQGSQVPKEKLVSPPVHRATSTASKVSSDAPSVTNSTPSVNNAETVTTTPAPTAIKPAVIKPTVITAAPSTSSETSEIATPQTAKPTTKPVPAPIQVAASPVSEPSLTPVPAPTKSFSVVVHSKTSGNGTDHSRSSNEHNAESRRSTSQDGHSLSRIRSKRNFKHLSANPEPPASPAANELSDLLKDAAWFEATLGAGFDIPSVTFDSATPDVSLKIPKSPSTSSGLQIKPQTPSASTSTLGADQDSDVPPTPPPKSARTRRFFSLRSRSARRVRTSMSSEMSSDDSAPVATPPSPTSEGPADVVSMRSGKSGVSSVGSSLRLSPHRGIARAATFAERMLGRSGKTKSMIDDFPTPIPEQPYQLPSIEHSFDISLSSDTSSPGGVSFNFDDFPSVPQDPRHSRAVTDSWLR